MAKNYHKGWAQIVARAWKDEVFKQRLLKNPKEVFKEYKIPCPENMKMKVVEDKTNECTFVIPAKPEGKLSEADIEKIVGGKGMLFSQDT